MSKRDGPVLWRCPEGHVLGVVERNGSNVSRLLLYRQAVDLEADAPGDPEVLGVLDGIGGMDSIRCSLCGGMRNWDPDREGMRRLLKKLATQRGGRDG